MSIAQILELAQDLPTSDLESLEHSIRLERLQRAGKLATAEETRLLQIINRPLAHYERFVVLTEKRQDERISLEERADLLEIVSEYERQNVERVEAVTQLSEMYGEPFEILWKKMMGEIPVPKGL